jgi:mRNA interferase RelE/StbE
MRYDVILADEAAADYKNLDARDRAKVRDGMEIHLRFEPAKVSKSRIKRLRGSRRPQFRLRIDDLRVFYDISGGTVEVLAIVPKSRAASWLASVGEPK